MQRTCKVCECLLPEGCGNRRLHCDKCRKEVDRQKQHKRNIERPELKAATNRRYNEQHPERVKEQHKKSYRKNIDKKRAYRKANRGPETTAYHRAHHLWCTFKMRPEEYDEILREQDGCCAICGRKQKYHYGNLAVDHDHFLKEEYAPGKFRYRVRGLLCRSCNMAIGQLKDSVSILERAIVYLKQHQQATLTLVPPLAAGDDS